jgi:hypothetical protein
MKGEFLKILKVPTSQVLVEWNLQADSNTVIFLQQINQQQTFCKNNK